MNFLEAMKLCIIYDKKVTRTDQDYKIWNNIKYIFYNGDLLSVCNNNNERRPYHISASDISNDDWEIYEEKPKTYTFQEAIYKLHNNEIGAIKRKNIPNGRYIFINDTSTLTISNTKDEPFLTYIPSIDDILAKDWEIIEDK